MTALLSLRRLGPLLNMTNISPSAGVSGPARWASSRPPAGYRWEFVTDNGERATDNGEPIVDLVRI